MNSYREMTANGGSKTTMAEWMLDVARKAKNKTVYGIAQDCETWERLNISSNDF